MSLPTDAAPDGARDPRRDAAIELLGCSEPAGAAHGERWWIRPVDDRAHDEATAAGLHRTRHLHQMIRPLPLESALVTGANPVPTRAMRPGDDDEAWVKVNAAAFAHHPEQGTWTLADLKEHQRAPWFDADDFRILELNAEMAGFCWMKYHRGAEPPIGEIFVIGVGPVHAGKGLGRSLAVDGLVTIWEHHHPPLAMLYVEADNEPALRLYGSLGFTIHHSEAAYELA